MMGRRTLSGRLRWDPKYDLCESREKTAFWTVNVSLRRAFLELPRSGGETGETPEPDLAVLRDGKKAAVWRPAEQL